MLQQPPFSILIRCARVRVPRASPPVTTSLSLSLSPPSHSHDTERRRVLSLQHARPLLDLWIRDCFDYESHT
ncbi:hypothetical protein IE53DRAFT_125272 [Violaceomyces palustris]|uniref:Uncharacterized protein n=1 Tax=Violaceomyces palustris TaxID=1673888 RepID=A0ACD0NVS8_9BASI|nr:hypothetical protein IE53DRAFT_125272 [Violaceomyces palustris]